MAAEITVLSSGTAHPGLDFVAAEFKKATGHIVKITYNMDEKGSQRLEEGEVWDMVVGSSDSLNRNFRPAGLVEEGGAILGRMGIGIMVRPGGHKPDISTPEGLKRACLDADALLLSNHSTGYYIDTVLKKMGIQDQVQGKIRRFPNGPDLQDAILAGKGKEFGFLSINQIRAYADKGVELVGPLPSEVAYVRDFIIVPTSKSPNKPVAWEFARYCEGPGQPLLLANGFF